MRRALGLVAILAALGAVAVGPALQSDAVAPVAPVFTAGPAATMRPERPIARSTARTTRARPEITECGEERARLVRLRVDVQEGLPVSEGSFRRGVMSILCDPRSWTASGRVRFEYDPEARIVIKLRDPDQTEERCMRLTGLSVLKRFSCAGSREAVLNSDRWIEGSPWWDGTVGKYRHLLVNHEFGHVLGQRHRSCRRPGAPAPAMMQQSKGLDGCLPNPWPLAYELRSVR